MLHKSSVNKGEQSTKRLPSPRSVDLNFGWRDFWNIQKICGDIQEIHRRLNSYSKAIQTKSRRWRKKAKRTTNNSVHAQKKTTNQKNSA